jgi:hypothetical protein
MNRKEAEAPETETLAGDLLEGAAAIAKFVKGDPRKRRTIYDMDPSILGLFHMGRTLCGLKSVIRQRTAALAEPERAGIADANEKAARAETKRLARAAKVAKIQAAKQEAGE